MKEKIYEFELYRLRLEKPRQQDLFDEFTDRSEVIKKSVNSKPQIALQQTVKWHIGNVSVSTEGWLYFLLGKTSLRNTDHFDEQSRDFINSLDEHSPYTHAILNPQNGILGIAKCTKLAKTQEISIKRLAKVFYLMSLKINNLSKDYNPSYGT